MSSDDLKWLQMIFMYQIRNLKSLRVILDNLELFKSWDDKISYTINMQHLQSYFCGVSETVWQKQICYKLDRPDST